MKNEKYFSLKRKKAARKNAPLECFHRIKLVFLFFFGSYNFRAVIESAALADSVRLCQLVAMRAFHQRGCSCFVICESLVRSALRLFALRYCHDYTSYIYIILLDYYFIDNGFLRNRLRRTSRAAYSP